MQTAGRPINPNIVIQLFKMMNICYAMFAIMCMQIKCHLIRDTRIDTNLLTLVVEYNSNILRPFTFEIFVKFLGIRLFQFLMLFNVSDGRSLYRSVSLQERGSSGQFASLQLQVQIYCEIDR